MNSGNPTLRAGVFNNPVNAPRWDELAARQSGTMTVQGTAIKAGILLAICVVSSIFAWMKFEPMYQAGNVGSMAPWVFGGAIGGLILSLIICFKPKTAPFLAPIYAAVQGLFIAGISLFLVAQAGAKSAGSGAATLNVGLIFQAASLTFGIAGAALLAYATGVVRLSPAAVKMVVVATGGVAVYALALMLMNGVFNMGLPNLWSSASPLGIGFSLFVIVLASFNLVLDYQVIDEGAKSGAPKFMEWYGAFALTVTLVWLYIEILRLLSKVNRRD